MDGIVITANHVVCVIIVNYNVIKGMGVLLKMRGVKMHSGLITVKVTGAAVKPDLQDRIPVDQRGRQVTVSSSNWVCLVILTDRTLSEKKENKKKQLSTSSRGM